MAEEIKKYKNFRSKTIAEIDAELEQDYEEYKKRKKVTTIVIIVVIFLLFHDAFLYWLRFATPHFAKYRTNEIINVNNEPIQTSIDPNSPDKFIMYHTLENRGTYKLEKLADYSISGKVLATNYYFWGNYIPGGNRPNQSIMLFDIGIGWGKLAQKNVYKYYRFYSAKDVTARYLVPSLKIGVKNPPLGYKDIYQYFSHTHVIPANGSIMHALIFARRYQPIRMDGYLVRIYIGDKKVDSSLTRNDYGCEIMYVNRIQVGKRVYE